MITCLKHFQTSKCQVRTNQLSTHSLMLVLHGWCSAELHEEPHWNRKHLFDVQLRMCIQEFWKNTHTHVRTHTHTHECSTKGNEKASGVLILIEYMDWNGLAQDRDRWWTLVSAVMNLQVPWNVGNFLTSCKPVSFSRRILHHGVSKYMESIKQWKEINKLYNGKWKCKVKN